jgi:hypothetical protein
VCLRKLCAPIIRDCRGRTPLHWAYRFQQLNGKMKPCFLCLLHGTCWCCVVYPPRPLCSNKVVGRHDAFMRPPNSPTGTCKRLPFDVPHLRSIIPISSFFLFLTGILLSFFLSYRYTSFFLFFLPVLFFLSFLVPLYSRVSIVSTIAPRWRVCVFTEACEKWNMYHQLPREYVCWLDDVERSASSTYSSYQTRLWRRTDNKSWAKVSPSGFRWWGDKCTGWWVGCFRSRGNMKFKSLSPSTTRYYSIHYR